MKRIAIIGGGIAGVTAAYELARLAREGAPIEATLFESTSRLGGIVETVREGGFIIECGPDAWVTEKPWARQLAEELSLTSELLPSNDTARRTYIYRDHALKPIPDGMSMMVPTNLDALEDRNGNLNEYPGPDSNSSDSPALFNAAARQAYRTEPARAAELKETIPITDESVASFIRRHFGNEVLSTIAAPLLSGVLGGDVDTLSVRAVMAPYVAMELEHGSLITALQSKSRANGTQKPALFTTLRSGLATLIERMVSTVPPAWLRLHTNVSQIARTNTGWTIQHSSISDSFDTILLATPADATRNLLAPIDPQAATLLEMDSSSAVIVAFALPDATRYPLPPGFGFLVPPPAANTNEAPSSLLLACTFTDQKFDHRVPPGGRLIRAFFGGRAATRLMGCNNDEIASVARLELARILGPMPEPQITVIRRWPRSLPQYAVGHLDRMASLEARIAQLPDLHLLGNAYRGVGLPDLIRDSRAAAHTAANH